MKRLACQGGFTRSWFWRTQQQNEIDYVEENDGMLSAFEFKWNDRRGGGKAPAAFRNAYQETPCQVITPHNIESFL